MRKVVGWAESDQEGQDHRVTAAAPDSLPRKALTVGLSSATAFGDASCRSCRGNVVAHEGTASHVAHSRYINGALFVRMENRRNTSPRVHSQVQPSDKQSPALVYSATKDATPSSIKNWLATRTSFSMASDCRQAGAAQFHMQRSRAEVIRR